MTEKLTRKEGNKALRRQIGRDTLRYSIGIAGSLGAGLLGRKALMKSKWVAGKMGKLAGMGPDKSFLTRGQIGSALKRFAPGMAERVGKGTSTRRKLAGLTAAGAPFVVADQLAGGIIQGPISAQSWEENKSLARKIGMDPKKHMNATRAALAPYPQSFELGYNRMSKKTQQRAKKGAAVAAPVALTGYLAARNRQGKTADAYRAVGRGVVKAAKYVGRKALTGGRG